MVKKTDTEKVPRSVEVKVLVPYVIITVFVSVVLGLIAGYFLVQSIQSDARQQVSKDFATVQAKKE